MNNYSTMSIDELLDRKKFLENQAVSLNNKQMASKIALNSLYGASSSPYFRYYDVRIAESITVSGQLTIRWTEMFINRALNQLFGTTKEDYVIAIDTDSNLFTLKKLFDLPKIREMLSKTGDTLDSRADIIDKFCKQSIEPLLDKAFEQLHKQQKTFKQAIKFKRESIASKGIWTGRKHYILNVIDQEGVRYTEPKLKIVGIEAVRSSTPGAFRQRIKDTIKVIMNGTEQDVQKHISNVKGDILELPPEAVAFPRSVSNLEKFSDSSSIYTNGCPIAVRAALLHNHQIKKYDLQGTIQSIYSGDKIKFCYLVQPNPIGENVFGFVDKIPREFKLDKYVDKETQYEKGFLEPLKTILAAIGWEHEKRATLDDFFKF